VLDLLAGGNQHGVAKVASVHRAAAARPQREHKIARTAADIEHAGAGYFEHF